MIKPQEYSFTRYLAAKKSIDDRSLNRPVWQTLAAHLPPSTPQEPVQVLEIGAGIGTMIERLWEWKLLQYATYTALDAQIENLVAAWRRLEEWSRQREDIDEIFSGEDLVFETAGRALEIRFLAADLFEFMETRPEPFDLLIANAFLDLVDLPSTLPELLRLIKPGGLFYFTINFDGLTHFEPVIDPVFDALIMELYHRTMDERLTAEKSSGDSRTGRHLFGHLKANGAEILQAGASDWVVFPGMHGYREDEAYFLHFILHTIQQALQGHPELERERFEAWIARRHLQVENGELVYITHQMDFVGTNKG
jgi:SAM-dependent methyltransferase